MPRLALLLALTALCAALPPLAHADQGTPGDRAPTGTPPAAPAAPERVPSTVAPAAPGTAGARAAGAGLPDVLRLTDGWEYRVAPRHDPSASDWRRVSIPHAFNADANPARFNGEIAWYRLRFRAPTAPTGVAFALRFESVRRQAVVYLNGRRIGDNDDPYTPFLVEARGLRKGATNELLVRVSNRKGIDPREGWWNWGGIVRPVDLVPRGRVTTDALGLLARVNGSLSRAVVTVDALVGNRSGRTLSPTLRLALTSPGGTVTRRTIRVGRLAAGRRKQVRVEVPVSGRPELWSQGEPRLYQAVVETHTDRLEQVDRERIGLRRLEVRDGVLLLNGRQVRARGAAIHEDLPGRGAGLTPAQADRFVADLKAIGANITRTHYLFSEHLLDRFDEEGILVWNEAPIWARDRVLRQAAGRREALAQLKRTVVGARNHPSVLTHSVANELSDTPDAHKTTRLYLLDAVKMVRKVDPTVPVSLAIRTKTDTPRQRTYRNFDLIGFNHYLGWYPCPPDPQTSLDDLSPHIDELRRFYPEQAILMSEFGAEATREGPATEKDTFAFQSDWTRRTLEVADAKPFLAGAIYWALREFAVRPGWDGGACRPASQNGTIHRKGLLTYDGAPKPAWEIARQRFAAFTAAPGRTP